MIPFDKFGNPIFPGKYRKLLESEKALLSRGFFESKHKPNLFCRKLPQGQVYADMRGTPEIPIWEDTRPLFYWNFVAATPMWERRRVIKTELRTVSEAGCPCRLSFFAHETREFNGISVFLDEDNGIFEWDDGFCRSCRTDFRNEGSFCSQKCKDEYEEGLKTPCEACGAKIETLREVKHHVSYFPEKVILVHAACHNKIHKTDLFPSLKPSDEEIVKFYGKAKPTGSD